MRRLRVLVVRAGGRPFALDVSVVRGIERPRRWARLPWAPSYVRGVVQIGGAVVSVVDLAPRLGLAPEPLLSSQGVVLLESAEPVGLAVEGIEGLSEIDLETLRDLGPRGLAAGARAMTPSGLVLLECEPLVDGRELESFAVLEGA